MKYDKLTYNWWRWPNILVPFGLTCIGIVILYYVLFAAPTTILDNLKDNGLKWFVIFIGAAFTGVGFCATITNYFGGDTYSLKSKVFFKDLDLLYVETMTKYDRKQNIKDWSFIY